MGFSLGTWAWGLVSYGLCHGWHVVVWRYLRPSRDILCLFALLLVPVPLVLWKFGGAAALTHFWLSAQYLAVYPALQASSPTLHLLDSLSRLPGGVESDRLLESMAGIDRHEDRALCLKRGGLVDADGGLSWSGRSLARAFLLYRRWLGLREGEG